MRGNVAEASTEHSKAPKSSGKAHVYGYTDSGKFFTGLCVASVFLITAGYGTMTQKEAPPRPWLMPPAASEVLLCSQGRRNVGCDCPPGVLGGGDL